MQELTLIFTGIAALCTTAATLFLRGRMWIEEAGAALSIVMWAVFGFGSMNIETYTECCGKVTSSEPGLAFIAVGLVGLNVVVLLWGATTFLDPRQQGV